MPKKPSPITSSVVLATKKNVDKEKKTTYLNFKVPTVFWKRFKQRALDENLKSVGLLYRIFDEWEAAQGNKQAK